MKMLLKIAVRCNEAFMRLSTRILETLSNHRDDLTWKVIMGEKLRLWERLWLRTLDRMLYSLRTRPKELAPEGREALNEFCRRESEPPPAMDTTSN